METKGENLSHEEDAESADVPRFDEEAKEAARPVVPLSLADSTDFYRRRERAVRGRGNTWPRGLILPLALVVAAAALAGALYRDDQTPAPIAAAPDTTSATHLAIAGAAAGVMNETEAASEPDQAASNSDDVTDESASPPRGTHARRASSSFGYVTERSDGDEDDRGKRDDDNDDDAEKRIERAREEAEKRAERARKEAEKMAERRREREKDVKPKPRLVGVYTLRSKH